MVRGLHVTGRGLSLYVDGCPGQYRYAEQAITAAGAWEELRADMRLALVAYRRWVKSGLGTAEISQMRSVSNADYQI